jgi:septal ring factor EnvC (AmiA/AmiB activator)
LPPVDTRFDSIGRAAGRRSFAAPTRVSTEWEGGFPMMQRLEQLEKVVERAAEHLQNLEKEREELMASLEEQKKLVQTKELELIRLRKEQQRMVEQQERETIQLKKERAQVEQKLTELVARFERFRAGEPGASSGNR